MNRKIVIIIIIIFCLSNNVIGGLSGEWYSISRRGLTKIILNDSFFVTVKNIDSLNSLIEDYQYDTLDIIKSYSSNNTLFILTNNNYNDYTFHKFIFSTECDCIQTGFIDSHIKYTPKIDDFDLLIKNDTSNLNFMNLYKEEKIISIYNSNYLSEINDKVLFNILEEIYNNLLNVKNYISKNNLENKANIMALALINKNIETQAMIKYGVFPIYNQNDYEKLIKTFENNKIIQKSLEKLNNL